MYVVWLGHFFNGTKCFACPIRRCSRMSSGDATDCGRAQWIPSDGFRASSYSFSAPWYVESGNYFSSLLNFGSGFTLLVIIFFLIASGLLLRPLHACCYIWRCCLYYFLLFLVPFAPFAFVYSLIEKIMSRVSAIVGPRVSRIF